MISTFIQEKRRPIGFILLVSGLAAAAGYLSANGFGSLIIFGLLAIPAGALVFARPQVGLLVLVLSAFSVEYLAGKGIIPTAGLWIMDVLTIILFARVAFQFNLASTRVWNPFFTILGGWLILMVASTIVTGTSPVQAVLGLRPYIIYPLLFYTLIAVPWDEIYLKRLTAGLVGLMFLQIPVTLFQNSIYTNPDEMMGSIAPSGGTGILSLLAVTFFSGLACYSLLRKSKLLILCASGLLVLPVLATARAFYFITPLLILYLAVRLFRKLSLFHVGVVLLVGASLLLNWDSIQTYTSRISITNLDVFSDPSAVFQELWLNPVAGSSGKSVGRLQGVSLALERMKESPTSLLFGFGPGAATGSRFSEVQSDLYDSLAQSGGKSAQLSRSLLEWGGPGTLLFILLFGLGILRGEKLYRLDTDHFWKAAAFSFSILSALLGGLSFYTATWSTTITTFMFWFLAGIVQSRLWMLEGRSEG